MSSMFGRDHQTRTDSGVRLTYDDFVLFPDDGKRHELIDGEHYVTPSPNTKHQMVAMNMAGLIWSYLQDHPVGRVFAAPFDVVFSDFDVVEPDILYMSTARAAEILTTKHVRGVPEYWVVDPDLDVVRIHRRARDHRAAQHFDRPVERRLDADAVLTSSLLPGLDIPLTSVFREPGTA